jgi:hypothetical protein
MSGSRGRCVVRVALDPHPPAGVIPAQRPGYGGEGLRSTIADLRPPRTKEGRIIEGDPDLSGPHPLHDHELDVFEARNGARTRRILGLGKLPRGRSHIRQLQRVLLRRPPVRQVLRLHVPVLAKESHLTLLKGLLLALALQEPLLQAIVLPLQVDDSLL